MKRQDLHRRVPPPPVIIGKEQIGEAAQQTRQLNSAGGVLTASHRERCTPSPPGESHPHDIGISYKTWRRQKAAKYSHPGARPQLRLWVKGSASTGGRNHLLEEWGEQKLAGHEVESLLRNTHNTSITTMYSESGLTISHHKARQARWITGWDLLEFITLLKIVACSQKQGVDCRSFQHGFCETTHRFCLLCATHCNLREEGVRIHSTVWGQIGLARDRTLLAGGR